MNEQSEKQAAIDQEIVRRIQEEAMKLGPGNIDFDMMAEIVVESVGEVTNVNAEERHKLKELLMDIANAAGKEPNRTLGNDLI